MNTTQFNFSDRIKNLSGNAIREIFKLLSRPKIISFAGGLPAAECIPVEDIAYFSQQCLKGGRERQILQYGATEGYFPLRQAMPNYLKRIGIEVAGVDNVLVVSGGQQGIDLTFKCFVNTGDVILTERPTYLAALHIAKTYQARTVGVDSDTQGACPDSIKKAILQHRPKVFYTVPNFQNPTGKTMSVERRREIARLCAEFGVVVLEDDPYRELRYGGEALPAIKSFDSAGNVIYLCSFSKTVSPALRTGIVAAHEDIIRKLTIGKQASDVHTCTLSQAIIERFISTGKLWQAIARAQPIYRERLEAMLAALDRYIHPDKLEYTHPQGGLFIWAELKDKNADASQILQRAVKNNVAFVPGGDFFPDGGGKNALRLNFSGNDCKRIDEGIKRLSEVL